jgi:5-methylcytosine-specific restriction endonuclease McrA
MKKRRVVSHAYQARLSASIRQSRRETLYKMLFKKHDGKVPCFVCGAHVEPKDASLEHIRPVSVGGTDDMDNLSISHNKCNVERGTGPDKYD